MKERIIKVMEHEGMGQAQFSAAIGIQRAAMSHIISGRNNPSLDVMLKILHRFPYIDPDWLLFGKGEMLRTGMEGGGLFGQSLSAPPEIKVVAEPEEGKQSPKEEETPHMESPSMPVISPESAPKRVERIMVFYSDNTFEAFVPEKPDKE